MPIIIIIDFLNRLFLLNGSQSQYQTIKQEWYEEDMVKNRSFLKALCIAYQQHEKKIEI